MWLYSIAISAAWLGHVEEDLHDVGYVAGLKCMRSWQLSWLPVVQK